MKLSFIHFFEIILALILFAIPYPFCMDGVGYGFPYSWYHHGHGEWGAYIIEPEEKFSSVIDSVNIVLSLGLWFLLVGITAWCTKFARRKF